MPELPWKKWFPQDWLSDPRLAHCTPATRGIWADAIFNMMLYGSDHLTGSDLYLARVCRCTEVEINLAHKEFEASKTCDVSMQNGCKIWTCRRLYRELTLSDIRRESANQRWCRGDANTDAKRHAKRTKQENASSVSASSSVLKKGETEGETTPEQIYAAYPLKRGKPDAIRAIKKAISRGYSPATLLERTQSFSKTRNGDLSFCPNPATWFNQERFNDDPSTWGTHNAQPIPSRPNDWKTKTKIV